MSKEIPKPWADAMERKSFTHNGRPSVSKLASKAEVAVETARRMIHGIGVAEQRNVNKIADALGESRITVNKWIGIARTVEEDYEPPADADLMDNEQRDAVDRIIQLFVNDKKEGTGSGTPAKKTLSAVPDLPVDDDSFAGPDPYASGLPLASDEPGEPSVGEQLRGEQDEDGEGHDAPDGQA